ncbi:MAG: hypothetical protein HC802_09495 [Caldilineaceae bacterium]|nr:hypothetical protein [Caldilineaceae bacterium]
MGIGLVFDVRPVCTLFACAMFVGRLTLLLRRGLARSDQVVYGQAAGGSVGTGVGSNSSSTDGVHPAMVTATSSATSNMENGSSSTPVGSGRVERLGSLV